MYTININKITKQNNNFRQVLLTGNHSQLVTMTLLPNEEIGMETHDQADQLLFFIDGKASVTVGDETQRIEKHDMVYVPAGKPHNVSNEGEENLKLFTIYAPATHADKTVHHTKGDATAAEALE